MSKTGRVFAILLPMLARSLLGKKEEAP